MTGRGASEGFLLLTQAMPSYTAIVVMVAECEGWVWLAMWKDWWQPYSSLRFAMRCYATSMQHRKLVTADVIGIE